MDLVKTQEAQKKGAYKATLIDTQKREADILVQAANGGSFTITLQGQVTLGKRGVKTDYGHGCYEVTDTKLQQLRQRYNVMTDF
ncbi:MAG: hypothetical protein GY797_09930 [Deltaproteobacteria bacterium]|nr:hypothetical protein [Deltaproteobacteria bacterium]